MCPKSQFFWGGVDKTCALADICFIFCCRGEQDLHEDGGFNPFFPNSNYILPYYFMFFSNAPKERLSWENGSS